MAYDDNADKQQITHSLKQFLTHVHLYRCPRKDMLWSSRKAINAVVLLVICTMLIISLILNENDTESAHANIISATYFEAAKNMPPNTMLILLTSQKYLVGSRSLKCFSESDDEELVSDMSIKNAVPEIIECKWTPYLAQCATVSNVRSLQIALAGDEQYFVQIPFRKSVERLYDVVTCVTPLFLNERWQLLVLAVEVYRYYGVDMQNIYVTSMVSAVYDLLKIYEERGWINIDPWPKMDFEHDLNYDPNKELEWRSQVAAQTDCLLKYKESARFIIFGDLDDILFPRLGTSYLSEFEALLEKEKSAAAFIYDRYESQLLFARQPTFYSIRRALQSVAISEEWLDGKWVAIPSRVITAAIHYPWIVSSPYVAIAVPNDTNFIAHFRTWTFSAVQVEETEGRKLWSLVDEKDINAIEESFRETVSSNVDLFNELPHAEVYYGLIEKCYNKIFYSVGKKSRVCPTHFHCTVPELRGFNCTIIRGRFEERRLANKFYIHYSYNWYIEQSDHGCTI